MQKQSSLAVKIIYFSALCVLFLGFTFFVLEKSQITNFYKKPIKTVSVNTADVARPVNDIQFTPASPTDNDEIEQKKADGTIDQSTPPPSDSDPIEITLTAAGQDTPGGPIVIRTLLPNVSSGDCTFVMSKDGTAKYYSSQIVNKGTYYGCDGFDVPAADLSAGSWSLTVSISSGQRSGAVQKNIEVIL